MSKNNEYLYLRRKAKEFKTIFRPETATILLVGMKVWDPERLIEGEIFDTNGSIVWVRWTGGPEHLREIGYSRLTAMQYRRAFVQIAI